MKKAYSVGILVTFLVGIGSLDVSDHSAEKTIQLGDASIEISREWSNVEIRVSNLSPDQEIQISRGGLEIDESNTESNLYRDDLSLNSSLDQYTITVESPLSGSSDLIAANKVDSRDLPNYAEIEVINLRVPQFDNNSDRALAASELPNRTRFRYQTFISEAYVSAPAIACAPEPNEYGYPVGMFKGDSRSWNPDSNSYRTRSDVVVDWSAGGTVTPYFSVGESTQVLAYPFNSFTFNKTASSEGLKLVRGVISPDYVSFHIYSDVVNPFCISQLTRGIFYDFAFYVHQTGEFVAKGTIRQVPNHELYTRNDVNSNWRTLFQAPNQGFGCLATFVEDCKKYQSELGDLVP